MTNAHHVLQIDDPGELLETVPYLLGFHPDDSVVLIGHTADHVVVTARMDLAVAETEVLHEGLQVLLRAGATMAIVVVYAAADDPPMRGASSETRLPHEVRACHVTGELDRAGLRVVDVIFVQDGSVVVLSRSCPRLC